MVTIGLVVFKTEVKNLKLLLMQDTPHNDAQRLIAITVGHLSHSGDLQIHVQYMAIFITPASFQLMPMQHKKGNSSKMELQIGLGLNNN